MILYNVLLTYDLFVTDGSEGGGGVVINLAYKMYIFISRIIMYAY